MKLFAIPMDEKVDNSSGRSVSLIVHKKHYVCSVAICMLHKKSRNLRTEESLELRNRYIHFKRKRVDGDDKIRRIIKLIKMIKNNNMMPYVPPPLL